MNKKAISLDILRKLLASMGAGTNHTVNAIGNKDKVMYGVTDRENVLNRYDPNQMVKLAGLGAILKSLASGAGKAPIAVAKKGAGIGGSLLTGMAGGLTGALALPALLGGGAYLAYKNPGKAKELADSTGASSAVKNLGSKFTSGVMDTLESDDRSSDAVLAARGFDFDDVKNTYKSIKDTANTARMFGPKIMSSMMEDYEG